MAPFKYKELQVSDEGFDITAYFVVPRIFKYKYYCFLNSFSIVLDSEWLLKLYQYISRKQVGLVGATGSYESRLPDDNLWKLLVEESIPKSKYPWLRKYWFGRLDWTLRYMISKWKLQWHFPSFPNFHIRSNVFMLREDVVKKIGCPEIRSKMDAYKCESGRRSITRQVEKLGKSVLVVGKDGEAYKKDDCWRSNTFWRSSQENLLVSDNQTRRYLSGDLKTKVHCSNSAWGPSAWPASDIF